MSFLDDLLNRRKVQDNTARIEQEMKPLIQKANARNVQKLKSGQINREQYQKQSDSILKNQDTSVRELGNGLIANTKKDNNIQSFLNNASSGIMNIAPQRIAGGIAEYGGTVIGNKGLRDWGTKQSQPFRDFNAVSYENADNKTVAMGSQIAGNLLTLPLAPTKMGLGVGFNAGGKALSRAVPVVTRFASAFAPQAADTSYAIRQGGGSENAQKIGGGAVGVVSGALNSIGGETVLSPFTKKLAGTNPVSKLLGSKLANSVGGRIAIAGNNEGLAEVVEQGVDNLVAQKTFDPTRKLTDNLAMSYGLGMGMGGVVRGGVEVGTRGAQAPTELTPELQAKRDALINGFTTAQDRGRTDLAQGLAKQIEQIDNPPVGSLRERIRTAMKLSGDQRGFVGDGSLLPEAPQLGKTDLDESRIFAMRDRPLDPRDLADADAPSGTVDAPLNTVDEGVESVDNLGGDATQAVASAVNKNADEAAQSIPNTKWFHGGTPINRESIRTSDLGYSVSSNRDVSKWFTNTKSGGNISEHTISANAKILSTQDIPQELLDKFSKFDPSVSLLENIQNGPTRIKQAEREIVAYARKNGYDAIDMRSEPFVIKGDGILDNEAEIRVLNPDILNDGSATNTPAPAALGDPNTRFSNFEPEVRAQLNKIMDELPNAQKSYMERTAPPVMQAPLKQLELKDATTPFSNEQENLVKEYASYLKSIDDSATGGQMLKTNDGYTRYSEHSPFYREYYAQYKRKPSKQAWEDHAREELIQGRADPTMQKPFNDLSDPEYRSLVQSQEKANSKGTVGDKFLTDPLEGKKIKVKGPMTDENYQARYGKTKEPTKVKVKPFTADDYAFEGWKDKSTLGLGRETLERNIDRVAGKDAPRIKKFLVDSSRQNETGRSKFLTSKRTEVNDYVVKKLGIKPKSNESALVQKFGEGLVDLKTLKQSTANWRNVVEGSKYFRREYDNLLDQWNSVRRKYGYQEVPKRKDYFRHFNEIQEGIAQLGIIKNAKDLPTNISGLTDIFKPSKPFSNAELRRYTNETTFDAVSGFDNYLDSVSRQIYHTDTVQKGRFLENKIRKASEQNPEIMLPNFVANLGEWTNLVSGKKARIDRAAEALVGRKVYAATDALRRQTSANMVGANLASALSNFIPFTQSISTTKKIPFAQGLFDTMFSPFKGSLREIDGVESSFLTRRFTKDAISKTGLKKAADVASTPFKLVDEFTSRSIVAGKYYEGLSDGLSPKMAMKAADDYASRVITDRSIGQTPNILNSKTAGFLTQFQTEVNNQVSFLIRDIPQFKNGNKLKIASALTQFVAFSYLFNEAYEGVIGRRPQIDPINAGLQLAGQGENSDKDLKERIKGASDDVLGGLPLSSLFTGGRLPVSSTLPDVGALTKGVSQIGSENDDARRNIYKGISGPLFYGLPPFGGGQLKKTLEAGNTISKGYSETPSGQIRFAADRDPLNIAKGLAFGQYSTDAGKEYIKNGIKPYGETDSELFKKTEDRDVLRSADTERKVNKEKEAVKSENNGNTLSNGKYYAKVGDEYKTFDSENDYKKAQVKAGKQKKIDDFVSSEEKTREIDGVMYLKSDNEKGYTTKTKAEWNFDKQTVGVDVGMDKAKASKDLKTWSELAKKKYNALVEKRKSYDPETEFDKIDLIDKQLLNIEQEYAKYASYGGFTKGKKQRSKGSGIDSTAFKVNNLTIDTYKKLDSLLSGTRRTASVAPPKITTRKPELKQIRVRA